MHTPDRAKLEMHECTTPRVWLLAFIFTVSTSTGPAAPLGKTLALELRRVGLSQSGVSLHPDTHTVRRGPPIARTFLSTWRMLSITLVENSFISRSS
jgi:hypothetical protein